MRDFRTGSWSEILSCALLKSNHMTFLIQFGNNLHFMCFQKAQIALKNPLVQIISKLSLKSYGYTNDIGIPSSFGAWFGISANWPFNSCAQVFQL